MWTVDKSAAFGAHDAEGWYYAPTFDRLAELIHKRTGADVATKTCLVRRRRWMRTMRCSNEAVLTHTQQRIERVSNARKHIEQIIREKEEGMRTLTFYEENRAFVYEQSLNLATQGTLGTFGVLKDLFFKVKRLYQVNLNIRFHFSCREILSMLNLQYIPSIFQFMSERSQIELEFSIKMDALGRKYGNSITGEAQNPLLVKNKERNVDQQQQLGSGEAIDTHNNNSNKASTYDAAASGALRSSLQSLSSLGVATKRLSIGTLGWDSGQPKPAANHNKEPGSPGMFDELAADMDDVTHGAHINSAKKAALAKAAVTVDEAEEEALAADAEEHYFSRDASAVLFNSLSAVSITAAERMKQFSNTLKTTAVQELEHVLKQIASLLTESKATFRKNRFERICYAIFSLKMHCNNCCFIYFVHTVIINLHTYVQRYLSTVRCRDQEVLSGSRGGARSCNQRLHCRSDGAG